MRHLVVIFLTQVFPIKKKPKGTVLLIVIYVK